MAKFLDLDDLEELKMKPVNDCTSIGGRNRLRVVIISLLEGQDKGHWFKIQIPPEQKGDSIVLFHLSLCQLRYLQYTNPVERTNSCEKENGTPAIIRLG